MLSFKSVFTPASTVDSTDIDGHIKAITNRVAAALVRLPPSEDEDSNLMPRWEIGLAKELVSDKVNQMPVHPVNP